MLFKLPGKKTADISDEYLLKEFQSSGDLELLGELYSAYMHLVYGVCMKYFRNRDESMDAVMQIFEKLVTEVPRHEIENFRNWLHIVTKNYCLMQIRSKKSQDERFSEWIIDSQIFMENGQYLHPLDREEPDTGKAIEECIERLKDEQRTCILKFYYENKCYQEIAVAMDLSEKKVKSYLQNGKRNLKLCLEEKHVGKEER
jgi:RNA polymerase sigma-70 factor (ECF subfamily)